MVSRIATLRAPNPSPMTLDGTNSYALETGDGGMLVIDPGPALSRHIVTLTEHARERACTVTAILVTHGHPDHAPGAELLHDATGAPVYAHASARFDHDVAVNAGRDEPQTLRFGEFAIEALYVPGHATDHLAFYEPRERALFTGDVVLGAGTVVVAPPSGDMRAYVASLRALRSRYADAATIFGGHGPRVDAPRAKLDEYIAHREERERQILAVLDRGPATIPQIVAELYAAAPRILWPVASRQALAHLIALEAEGTVRETRLDRPITPEEKAILSPDIPAFADPELAALAEAEFGRATTDAISQYARTGAAA